MTLQDVYNKFDEFYNQNINQSVEAEDPSALDQCMDLAFKWCDALGIPREAIRHQFAHEVWDNPNDTTRQYFDLLDNTDSFVPQKGDLAVFKVISGIPVGHISIDTGKSDTHNLITFDQNWDTLHYFHLDGNGNHIPYCRVVTHTNYYGIAGFLRAKVDPPIPEPPPLTDDEKRALEVLKSHELIAVDLNNQPFGNLEGYTRCLVEDAYNAWHNPHPVTPAPPVVTTVVTEPQFKSSLGKFFYSLAKSSG